MLLSCAGWCCLCLSTLSCLPRLHCVQLLHLTLRFCVVWTDLVYLVCGQLCLPRCCSHCDYFACSTSESWPLMLRCEGNNSGGTCHWVTFSSVHRSLYLFCCVNAQLGASTGLCAGTLFVLPCDLPGALLLEPAVMLSRVGLHGPSPGFYARIWGFFLLGHSHL